MTAAVPVAGQRRRRPLWRRALGPLLSVALVVAVFAWFLPQFTSLSDVWASVRGMTAVEVVVLLLAAGWNLATYQFVLVATMPGLTLRQATVSSLTTTAVSNTVVGGAGLALGLTYAMNSSWGFSRSRTSVSLLVSGLWNNFVKLGTPVLALTLLAFSAPPTAGRLAAGLAGVAGLAGAVGVLGLLLRSRETPPGSERSPVGPPRRCCGSCTVRRCTAGSGPRAGSATGRRCCCTPDGRASRWPPSSATSRCSSCSCSRCGSSG